MCLYTNTFITVFNKPFRCFAWICTQIVTKTVTKQGVSMAHILRKGERYYYNRRLPEHVRMLANRDFIRVALHTDSKTEARQKSIVFNQQIEAYWDSLVTDGVFHDNNRFRKAVTIARRMGLGYQPLSVISQLPLPELAQRVMAAAGGTPDQVASVLGGYGEPALAIRQALDKFWGYTKDRILNKAPDQVRKWKNPRKRAVNNFVKVVGNKPITEISREDILKFRDW